MHLMLLLQEAEAPSGGAALLSPNAGLMLWTFILFIALYFILSKFAFPKITEAVEAREAALQAAIDAAKQDRDAAAKLLADQRGQLESARDEAQRIINEGRAAGEQLRAKMLEETHTEQQNMLDRARREIGAERDRAIAELRREAVDLAIAGASKVIAKNLDDAANRQIVESFLATIPTQTSTKANG